MSRTNTPKYALGIDGMDCATWDCKRYGRPTEKNLEAYVMNYAKSLEIGGCNEHISKSLGHIPYPRKAQIRLNRADGKIVASWNAGMFQVYG